MNIKAIQRFCMQAYGWTITEVKNQPYFELLNLLNTDEEKEAEQKTEEPKMYTGSNLKHLFGG